MSLGPTPVLTGTERALHAYDRIIRDRVQRHARKSAALRGYEVRGSHIAARWADRLLYPGTTDYIAGRIAIWLAGHGHRSLANRAYGLARRTPRWDTMQRKIRQRYIDARHVEAARAFAAIHYEPQVYHYDETTGRAYPVTA